MLCTTFGTKLLLLLFFLHCISLTCISLTSLNSVINKKFTF